MAVGFRPVGQLGGQVALAGVAGEVKRRHFFEPGIFVGREDRKRRQALGQHLVARKNAVVFAAQQHAAIGLETAGHLRIARQSGRFVIVIAEDGASPQLAGQRRNDLLRQAASGDEACLRAACGVANGFVQLGHALADELYPAVGVGQGGEDAVVENKDAIQRFAVLRSMVEGGVIGQAQVAPEPYQAHRVKRSHGSPLKSQLCLQNLRLST